MKALFVFAVSAGLLAQEGSTPKPPLVEPVVVGTFSQTDNIDAANLMRANAEIATLSATAKPLNDQLQALEKSKGPWQAEMTARLAALCKASKVPEESIKANECTARVARDKDGKDVLEIVWERKKK